VKLSINGEPREVGAATVAELVEELGHRPEQQGIAVAVNDEVVPRSRWADWALSERDRVEVVGAVQGG